MTTQATSAKSLVSEPNRASAVAKSVTREDVIWCYRLLLGREPESEEAIINKMYHPNRVELLRAFLASGEFLNGQVNEDRPDYFDARKPPLVVECEPSQEQLDELFDRVRQTWRNLGELKPHWSVLSEAEFLPENLEHTREIFYKRGAGDLSRLLGILRRIGRDPREFSTVHEFGCGLGRITNHLATVFDRVIGCDISASHLQLAREYSDSIGAHNITYREVSVADFGMQEPVDLWFSVIVLQHNPPPIIFEILKMMFSKLRQGGVAVFQIPVYRDNYRFVTSEYLNQALDKENFEMHVLPQKTIFELIRKSGCEILEVIEDGSTGNLRWVSNTIAVGRA